MPGIFLKGEPAYADKGASPFAGTNVHFGFKVKGVPDVVLLPDECKSFLITN